MDLTWTNARIESSHLGIEGHARDLASPEAWTFVLDEARRPEWWDADCDDRARSACWAAIEGMFTTTDGRLDLAEARFLHRVRRSVRKVCVPSRWMKCRSGSVSLLRT